MLLFDTRNFNCCSYRTVILSKNKNIQNTYISIFNRHTILFYAVRLYVGTDYYNYVINFLRIKSGYHIRMEIGYVLLNKLCAGLNFKAEMMFFIISLIFSLLYAAAWQTIWIY